MRQMTNPQKEQQQFPVSDEDNNHFHSVEFHVHGLKLLYQSRIWSSGSEPMFTLVKEDSDILKSIHVGDIVNMKFYSSDRYCPPRDLETKIKYITKDTRGRFKGHFLVGLTIISN